jgi:MarR family 2-MHQ and catechol resistance regulon transcriptional repressor
VEAVSIAAAPSDEVARFLDAFQTFARAIRRSRGARPRAGSAALTLSQYGLLEPLLDQRAARSSELAEAAGITASTTTRILDALERNGIVQRERSVSDRRAVSVRLTAEGREQLAAHRDWMQARELALYEALDPEQRAVAEDLLLRLAALSDELAAGPDY